MASAVEPAEAAVFCGYCIDGETQCPDLEVLFPDRCPTWCGAETYATGCSVSTSCGFAPSYGLRISCGVIQ